MRTTSQPRSARTMPVKGAIAMPASSRTGYGIFVNSIMFLVGVDSAVLTFQPRQRWLSRIVVQGHCSMLVPIVASRLSYDLIS